jgi:hypothetical protein
MRRSIEENLPLNFLGSQLFNILQNLSNQLNGIELPTGLQRDRPFQSCLDLHDQSKPGKQTLLSFL